MRVIFQDKVPTYYFIVALLAMTAIVFGVLLGSQFTNWAVPLSGLVKVIIAAVFILNLVGLMTLRVLKIELTPEQIIFGFAPFRRRYYLSQIEKAEISNYEFKNYLGYGIRIGRDGTLGYVPRSGRGLKIKVRGRRREYFFVCNKPEELKKLIEERKQLL